MAKGKIISGIDIGTSKITTVIASQMEETDKVNVIGVATYPSAGLRKSQIVDIEEAIGAITQSVEAAERMAGCSIAKAFISINGSHVKSQNSKGVVAVAEPEGEIIMDDISRVVEAARAISLPTSREILHVIPRDFIVDSQEGIKDPLGMTGVRLEVETHIVTGSSTAMKNLVKCVQELGIDIESLVFSGLAASESVLTDTEKELGVCLVDIGGGTTSIAIFIEGSLAYSSVLPVGAKNITNDLAIGLRVSLDSAEKIKKALEKRKPLEKKEDDNLDLSKLDLEEHLSKVSKKTVVEGIIHPRLKEIFQMVGEELKKSGYGGGTPAGIVLTGGGSRTTDIIQVCKRTLALPVRVGTPSGLSGLIDEIKSSDFAVSQGLILYGLKNFERESGSSFSLSKIGNILGRIPAKGAIHKVTDFIKSFLP
ncbi:cell division protein FtsA [Candidatus Beckwithbacteria bacterium CG10_big_fil_rev_8_21_14_0_10_34_10]|uniref:Cell division protein FtsA n=1 Tax=Candidatus Beckwithbacteria bacterium CG10_big_fil_rev_8_21_14_0_10_34_10 TaxID=1974495 RepID=A0A2H0W902_9BACT|nr:MAG: cell division protein FtsA [Candidatus Beckwithbacteria bacterium CG10_big_fil_rev_8_21_14_0_10_34_10]